MKLIGVKTTVKKELIRL